MELLKILPCTEGPLLPGATTAEHNSFSDSRQSGEGHRNVVLGGHRDRLCTVRLGYVTADLLVLLSCRIDVEGWLNPLPRW